jgi:hypothetical protein
VIWLTVRNEKNALKKNELQKLCKRNSPALKTSRIRGVVDNSVHKSVKHGKQELFSGAPEQTKVL